MKIEQIKEELIKRYKYIYENATIILAPYMYQQSKEEKEKLDEYYKKRKLDTFTNDKLFIYLKNLPVELLLNLESFLLSDISLEESKLYDEIESKKKDPEYLTRVKNGIELLKLKNQDLSMPSLHERLDSRKLYFLVREFIINQSGDLKNKDKKLFALDEYFRINRYTNDGKIWTSGAADNFKDMQNYSDYNYSTIILKEPRNPSRDKSDIGLKKGLFISFVANPKNHYSENFSMLTEQEKQNIYLTYHDELPWDLEITCSIEDENIPLKNETGLVRPIHTAPCENTFNIVEEEIFVNPIDTLHRYYQVCPHCGWIVNIPKEILSEGIKERIEKRCSLDPNLFRKMYLYSELFSLQKHTSQGKENCLKLIKNKQKED